MAERCSTEPGAGRRGGAREGRFARLAKIVGSEEDAEAIITARVERKRAAYRRHRCGAKKRTRPAPHHLEWLHLFSELEAELEQGYREALELDLPGAQDGRPTNWHISLAVAEWDCGEHPERWRDYLAADGQLDARRARQAADRVWTAVKPLLSAQSEITGP
jgi:hypothetical protein